MALVPAGVQLIVEGAQAFQKALDDAGKAIGNVGDAALKSASGGIKGLAGALSGPLVVGAGAAVGAIAGVGAALNSAMERNQEFRAALGADFDANAIAAISDDVALLERRFGVSLPEQMDAARALVTNGLAPDFESAMDILNAGFAEGLNVSDDLIDTLREYPTYFANLGFSADDALSILNRGLEAGARNTDVIADAVKEFGILIREPATLAAVSELDAGVANLVGQFQQGKISGEDAFNGIIGAIMAIEDPILRNTVGVEVFGTKWEDLGEKAIAALADTGEGLITSAGAADEAAAKITSFSEILPRIGDKIGTALAPAADVVLAFANEHWPAFEAAVDSVIGTGGNFVSAMGGNRDALAELPAPLAAVVTGIDDAKAAWDAFGATPLGQAVIGGAQEFGAYISGPWQADIQAGVGVVQGAFDTFAQSEWGQTIQRGANVVADYFLNEWPGDLQAGVTVAQGALDRFAADIQPWTSDVQTGAQVVADYMMTDFPSDFSTGVDTASTFLAELPENVSKFFGEIPTRISGIIESAKAEAGKVGSAIIDGVTSGIKNGIGSVIAAAQQMASDTLDAAMKALKMGSPSREFRDRVGLPIVQGVAVGIERGIPIAQAAITRAAMETVVSADKALKIGGGKSEEVAERIGRPVSEGIAFGIGRSISLVQNAGAKAGTEVLMAARRTLRISSPSGAFADDVGKPITEGMAGGMLDNVQILLDAAREISSSVLDEATVFADQLRSVLGPILAESFGAAADFARGQAGGIAQLDSLFPRVDELTASGLRLIDMQEELTRLQNTAVDTSARADVTTDRDEALADVGRERDEALTDERNALRDKLAELDEERARLEVTARQNIDPQKRLDAEERLIELQRTRNDLIKESGDREKAIRDKAADDEKAIRDRFANEINKVNDQIAQAEIDRQQRIDDLTRQLGAETNERNKALKIHEAQEKIAEEAQKAIAEAQRQAAAIDDPAARAAFFELRQRQILEIARLEQEAAAEDNHLYRSRIQQRIDLTRQAQQFEFQAFEEQQNQRRQQQQQALTEAGDALKQLRDLVYFSQIDLNGVGSDALRGIADGIIAQTATLSQVLTQSLSDVMAAARQALGIASPSRVAAMTIGVPLAQGIAAGFAAEVPNVAAQLSAQVTAMVQPVASAAAITTNNIRQSSSTTNYTIDARGAAPGVERGIVGAIKRVQNLTGAKSDIIRRMA